MTEAPLACPCSSSSLLIHLLPPSPESLAHGHQHSPPSSSLQQSIRATDSRYNLSFISLRFPLLHVIIFQPFASDFKLLLLLEVFDRKIGRNALPSETEEGGLGVRVGGRGEGKTAEAR